MKKELLTGLALALLLSGCSDGAAAPEEEAETAETPAAEPETASGGIPDFYEGYVANPQVTDDRALTETGQTVRDANGQITLKAIASPDAAVEIGGIELTVHEAKVFMFQPDYSLTDFYHHYTDEEEFAVVKAFVSFTNTTDAPLQFAPVALASTDTGEERTWEDDIYLEEMNGEIALGETVKGSIGFVVDDAEVGSLTLTTSDVFSADDEKVADAAKIEIQFTE
ncbi:DUF4352 domain-containing protein [Indiicoccus explosivorum]|uniref:DUF4352 domain-containing protein n=1 Tax=Indiicoccus explosivorum TaxID=1917864 RepID=UPI000B43EDFE|nr:DUF4352 domain-containing protein [Indiicoccus explosivorum]